MIVRYAVVLAVALGATTATAQEPARDAAPVVVDGDLLFRVRGIEALPAADRAAGIAGRIAALAADRSLSPDSLRVVETGTLTNIMAGPVVVVALSDPDASLEGIARPLLAEIAVNRIRRAILEWRDARTSARLMAGLLESLVAFGLAAAALLVWLVLLRRVAAALQRASDRRAAMLAAQSRQALYIDHARQAARGAIRILRFAGVIFVIVVLLQYVLLRFPWTRGAGLTLFSYVAGPLGGLGRGFVAAIPNLIFLAILFFLTRYLLSLLRLYFGAIEKGSVTLRNFEPDWARPTYALIRVFVVATALVIAYPYIPGSQSEAFKGISILAGLVFSLGSSSAVANIVAGYMLVYRRSFRIGDRVRIGDVYGDVTDLRLQVTHVRTVKHEEITIPNAAVLSRDVVNYSKPARDKRLVLYTQVGIGYGTPWRQVEALLLQAAGRTAGLLKDPPPFIRHHGLGEFAVRYEINAYCDDASSIEATYTELSRNILDAFNEHGVQIMTPAYEGDPEKAKIVAKDRWFTAPARQEGG